MRVSVFASAVIAVVVIIYSGGWLLYERLGLWYQATPTAWQNALLLLCGSFILCSVVSFAGYSARHATSSSKPAQEQRTPQEPPREPIPPDPVATVPPEIVTTLKDMDTILHDLHAFDKIRDLRLATALTDKKTLQEKVTELEDKLKPVDKDLDTGGSKTVQGS